MSPSEKFRYVLHATMLQAGNYTIGVIMRSTRVVAVSTTLGCAASVVCAALSVVTINQAQLSNLQSNTVQVAVSAFDSFGNARADGWHSTCTAEVAASAIMNGGDVLSVAISDGSCQCCTSAHVVMAGGPAISASPALIHPVFDFFTGKLSSAAVTPDASFGTTSRGYAVQPPVSVLISALPLLKLQLVDAASSSLWPGEATAASTPLALLNAVYNASLLQHVFSYSVPPAAAARDKLIRVEPFQLLHGALLATYYKLRADVSKTSVVLSDQGDALSCMTAAVSAPLLDFQGKPFPNLQCGGAASITSYAVRYHGFVRRSSAAALTFMFHETRPATFFSIYVDQQPLPVASAHPSLTWATGSTLPSLTATAVIPPRSDGSMFHEVVVNVRGPPMTWPPPLPLFLETECRHSFSVINASAGVFTTTAPHALVGGEAVMFEGSALLPPLAAGSVFYVLRTSISRHSFSVALSRLGTSNVAAEWSGGTVLILGKCGVYAPFALDTGVLHSK